MVKFPIWYTVSFVTAAAILLDGQRGMAQENQYTSRPVRMGAGRTVLSTRANPLANRSTPAPASTSLGGHPRPKYFGFQALVAIATSDERSFTDIDYEHNLHNGYVGDPLITAGDEDFVVGLIDTGASFDFASGSHADMLGLSGSMLTENTVPVSGVGGQVMFVPITQPMGYFAGGLSAVNPDGSLNPSAVVGHSNVSLVALDPIICAGSEFPIAVMGTAFISFFDTIIRVDTPRTVTAAGGTITGPDVQLGTNLAAPFTIVHSVSIDFGALFPALTASYYPDFSDPDFRVPFLPTQLSFSALDFPLGGNYYDTLTVEHGDSGPQSVRVLVDTGAQSSIITPGLVADLSLPFEPDFFAQVCGIDGLVSDVPGYYIDYVRIAAQGGALEFSRAPFVVLDIAAPDGGAMGGILGMNFFWNRNVRMRLSLDGSSFLDLSGPIPVAYGDSDVDFDVDGEDYAFLADCTSVEGLPPECDHLDVDGNGVVGLMEYGRFQLCHSGAGATAHPDCAALAAGL